MEDRKKIIIALVKSAKAKSVECLKHFFELLDLDSDAFSHLYNIPIKVGNTIGDGSGQYDLESNTLVISYDYLNELVDSYMYSKDKDKALDNIILNIALIIIHESIHADRTVLIENSRNSINIDSDDKSTDITLASDSYLGNEEDKEKIDARLANLYGFEEILTESIATIILFSRDDEVLNLDAVCDRIINSKGNYDDVKVAVKFLKDMGIDIIKWFLTSAYSEYYVDEFEMIFKDKYDDLLYDFNDIYEANLYNDKPSPYSIKDINDIVSSRKR